MCIRPAEKNVCDCCIEHTQCLLITARLEYDITKSFLDNLQIAYGRYDRSEIDYNFIDRVELYNTLKYICDNDNLKILDDINKKKLINKIKKRKINIAELKEQIEQIEYVKENI